MIAGKGGREGGGGRHTKTSVKRKEYVELQAEEASRRFGNPAICVAAKVYVVQGLRLGGSQ